MDEKRYQKIFKMSPDPSYIIKVNGIIQEVNNVFCKLSGYNKDEIIGLSIKKTVPFLPEEDRKKNFGSLTNVVKSK